MTGSIYDDFAHGEAIRFRVGPQGTRYRNGTYHGIVPNHDGLVLVQLQGDPYAISVPREQVEHNAQHESAETSRGDRHTMATATATKPTAKELRRKAKGLGVEGWEEMTSSELQEAINEREDPPAPTKTVKRAKTAAAEDEAPRKRTAKSSTKAAPKKARTAQPDEDEDDGSNPYKPGSNLYLICEELLKGGKRSDMVKRLKKKIDLKPRQRAGDDYDVDAELDRRVLIVGQLLEKDHGFTVNREGRGKDAYIQAVKE